MKTITEYIYESQDSDYKEYKTKLGRYGFTPNGKTSDEWDFKFIDMDSSTHESFGHYDIIIYLDNNNKPFEFRLMCDCTNSEDYDKTFNSMEELISEYKQLKKQNRKG